MALVVVNVALDDRARREPDRCLTELESVGLRHIRFRRVIGIATGEVDADLLDALRSVTGVAAVDEDREVRPTELPAEADSGVAGVPAEPEAGADGDGGRG